MKAKPTEPGRVVVSTQGHDAGHWYAVWQVLDERCVLLVNGTTRKLEKPKKKQIKHLCALPLTIAVSGRGESGGPVADSDIRKALSACKAAYETQTGWPHTPANRDLEKEEGALVQE